MDETIIIRISEEDKRAAVHDAHRHDMNLSEYIRFCLALNHELLRRKDEKEGENNVLQNR